MLCLKNLCLAVKIRQFNWKFVVAILGIEEYGFLHVLKTMQLTKLQINYNTRNETKVNEN